MQAGCRLGAWGRAHWYPHLKEAGSAAEERAAEARQQREREVALGHGCLGLLVAAVAGRHVGVQRGAAVTVVHQTCLDALERLTKSGVVSVWPSVEW